VSELNTWGIFKGPGVHCYVSDEPDALVLDEEKFW
jgi:hypothetical protein